MTTLIGLNVTVIKIGGLSLLRKFEILWGFSFANVLLSAFLQILRIENRNKQSANTNTVDY